MRVRPNRIATEYQPDGNIFQMNISNSLLNMFKKFTIVIEGEWVINCWFFWCSSTYLLSVDLVQGYTSGRGYFSDFNMVIVMTKPDVIMKVPFNRAPCKSVALTFSVCQTLFEEK